jgi:hypothetical protein
MVSRSRECRRKSVDDRKMENMENFSHLGSTVTFNRDCKNEIPLRSAKAVANPRLWTRSGEAKKSNYGRT